jgi:hypothetical protein
MAGILLCFLVSDTRPPRREFPSGFNEPPLTHVLLASHLRCHAIRRREGTFKIEDYFQLAASDMAPRARAWCGDEITAVRLRSYNVNVARRRAHYRSSQ